MNRTYPESIVDAMGILCDIGAERGASVVVSTDTTGYAPIASAAERDGRFVGRALDPDTQSSKTNRRIEA